jgi:hypothetical protein
MAPAASIMMTAKMMPPAIMSMAAEYGAAVAQVKYQNGT